MSLGKLLPRLGLHRRFRRLRFAMGLERELTVTYLGHPFSYPAGSLIGDVVSAGGAWDGVLRDLAAQLLPNEPVICEVGSNIGASLMQVLAARPHARAIAIEPSDRFRPFLERNLLAAGHHRVEILSIALGATPGPLWLYNNASTASAIGAEYDGHEGRGRQRAEASTLDELWAKRGRLDLLKIDTDGYEAAVLAGGKVTLATHRPLIFMELAPHLGNSGTALALLRDAGYRRFTCLSPVPGIRLIGVSEDPDQVIGWAEAETFRYCDIVTCAPNPEYEAHLETTIRHHIEGMLETRT